VILPDEHHLWRRLIDDPNHIVWDSELGWLPNPRSAISLQMNPDLSMQWREHLRRHNIAPAGILGEDGRYTLAAELLIDDARALRFSVTHSPLGPSPLDCSHTSVDWPMDQTQNPPARPNRDERLRLRYDMSAKFKLVYGNVRTQVPEGS